MILVAEDVRRTLGDVNAVDGVDLAVDTGELVVVAGPSGSGKTTLLQLLGALDRPSGGTVRFNGEDLGAMSDVELARLRREHLGFVFQQFNLIPTLSALQNVEMALAPTRTSSRAARSRASELLGRVGLSGRLGHLPSQLSGGEQQRVAIARALANEPEVLLADEPTGNLDSTTGDEIIGVLRSLVADGLAIVLVTHDPVVAARGDRIVRMADGRINTAALERYEYVALVEQARDGTFTAHVPDLAGLSATGATREEAERHIRTAIADHLDTLSAEGRPIPPPVTTAYNVGLRAPGG